MPTWIIKAFLQKVISYLPYSESINYYCQRYVTKGLNLQEAYFARKLTECQHFYHDYGKYGKQPRKSFNVLELGTGWHPIIPIGLYLCGAEEIFTIDIVNHLRPESLKEVLVFFSDWAERGQLSKLLPIKDETRIARLQSLAMQKNVTDPRQLLQRLNIKVVIADVCRWAGSLGRVDLIVSNDVLQHIPPQVISDIFNTLRNMANDTSIMIHNINMIDHYSLTDKNIAPFNFLQYSDNYWKIYNNSLHYQNRLRMSDYSNIHNKTGWKILSTEIMKGNIADIDKIKLNNKFTAYPKEDLLIIRGWIVSKIK